MADVQSNIQVNLDASQALAQLKELQRQLATFHSSVATTSSAAAKAQASLQSNLINSVNATGKFAASLTTIKSSADSFTDSLERNKFSTREYFRYAGGATKTFGRIFKQEFDTIGKVAEERVKTMQTQYIKMGRDANGAIKAIAVRPLALDMENLGTKTALAAQKQQLFNQLMKQGSTNLLNFGKNTQWAGRQLMVGFTVPLTMLGMTAGKTFMALEKQAIRFKRVYGEMFTTTAETERAFRDIELLAKSFTKYGVAVEKTLEMAADAAATGKVGADLMAQVAEATRLAVLGGVEQEKALETTISLTNAFGIAADELRQKIDFLNAVENQTILNIEDLTIAVPKAGPVIKQLGGDVEDLAFFMTAMKEGGINASEGANALKSGLASMINPSKKAAAFLQDLGINLNGIVEANKGNIKNTVVQFAQALDTLAPLERSRAIEQLFGKFQFARLSTLFQNITKDGSQAARTLNLAGASVQELAILSERELKKVEDATGTKFKKSIEDLKVSLMPVGKEFLKALTPIVEFIGKILEKFNGLSDGAKARITKFIAIIGIIGPAVLMTFGLVANGVANLLKLFVTLRKGFFGLGGQSKTLGQQIQYMSSEQIEAATVAASLNQAHSRLRQTFLLEAASLNTLTTAYQRGMVAANNFARKNPGMMKPGFRSGAPKKFADGGWVPGTGNKDTVPAVLTPGEFVVRKDAAQENKGFLQRLNKGGFVLRGDGSGTFKNIQDPWAGEAKGGPRYDSTLPKFRPGSIEYAKAMVEKITKERQQKTLFLGMPNKFKQVQEIRQQDAVLSQIDGEIRSGNLDKIKPTNFGKMVAESSGRSFPVPGIGGIYERPDGSKVFVKPFLDEKSAVAEMRGTKIARDVHGLVSPDQKLSTMIDPNNPGRKLIVLQSPFDPKFAEMTGEFTKSDFVKQAVASVIRGDKDLSKSNVSGNRLPDVGTAGVFATASAKLPGERQFGGMLPVKDQAVVNFLGVSGGAKRYFADATRSIAQSMTPAQYERAMLDELDRVLPKLKSTIAGFGTLNPEEKVAYAAMVQRVEDAKKIDWKAIHKVHVEAKVPKIKKPKIKATEKAGEKGHRVSIKDPAFRKLLVARGFKPKFDGTRTTKKVPQIDFGDEKIVPIGSGGVTHLHDPKTPIKPSGFLGSAGQLGPGGYNQIERYFPKAPNPYPYSINDALKTEEMFIDDLERSKSIIENPKSNKADIIAAKTRAKFVRNALAELQADLGDMHIKRGSRPSSRHNAKWQNMVADRVATWHAMAEGEDPTGESFKKVKKTFLSSIRGRNTVQGQSRWSKNRLTLGLTEAGIQEDISRLGQGKGQPHGRLTGGRTSSKELEKIDKNSPLYNSLKNLMTFSKVGKGPAVFNPTKSSVSKYAPSGFYAKGGLVPRAKQTTNNIVKSSSKSQSKTLLNSSGRLSSNTLIKNLTPKQKKIYQETVKTLGNYVENSEGNLAIENALKAGIPKELIGKTLIKRWKDGFYPITQLKKYGSLTKSLATKESGTFFRGTGLSGKEYYQKKLATIPPEMSGEIYKILNTLNGAEQQQALNKFIGQSFKMRTSSWSANEPIASGFATNARKGASNKKDVIPFKVKTSFEDQKVIPVHSLYKEMYGKGNFTEQERMFGGGFVIKGISPKGITVERVSGFASGGSVPGYGEKDTVPALLTPGEFVVNKAATQEHGPILQAMNSGKVEYREGGTGSIFDDPKPTPYYPNPYDEIGKPGQGNTYSKPIDDPFADIGKVIDKPMKKTAIKFAGTVSKKLETSMPKIGKSLGNVVNEVMADRMAIRAAQDAYDDDEYDASTKQSQRYKDIRDGRSQPAWKEGRASNTDDIRVAQVRATQDRVNADFEKQKNKINPKPKPLTKRQKRIAKYNANAKDPMRGQRASGGLMAAGMGLGMVAASAPDSQAGKVATQLAPIAMAGSMIAPMIGKPSGAIIGPIAALAGALIMLRMRFDKAQDAALALGEATGTSTKAVQSFAEFAFRATGAEVMDKKRLADRGQLVAATGKTTFGQSFVQSEAGQKLGKSFQENLNKNGKAQAQKDLQAQLETAVLSNALTAEQAQSVAANIGASLGDATIGIQIAGKLQGIFGKNGDDITKSGVEIQAKLMENSSTKTAGSIEKLNKGTAGMMNHEVSTGAMVASGAVAGGLLGGSIAGPIGAMVGVAVGAIAGGAIAWFSNKGNVKKIGELSGAAVADATTMFEQSKQLLDNYEAQYIKRREQLVLEGKISDIQKLDAKYDTNRLKITDMQIKQREEFLSAYKSTTGVGRKGFDTALDKQMTSKYKGTGQELYVGAAKTDLAEAVKSKKLTSDQAAQLKVQVNAGELTPRDISKMVETFTGKDDLTTMFTISTKFGGEEVAAITDIVSQFRDENGKPIPKLNTEFALQMKGKTDKEAQASITAFQGITELGGVLNLDTEIDYILKNENVQKEISKDLKLIKEKKGKFSMDFLASIDTNFKGTMDEAYFKTLTNPKEREKYVTTLSTMLNIENAVLIKDPGFLKWLGDTGEFGGSEYKDLSPVQQLAKYREIIAKMVSSGQIDTSLMPEPPKPGGGGGSRSTILDDTLKKLKQIQRSSVNAMGGQPELIKQVMGKNAIGYGDGQGVDQKLLKDNKVSSEFLDFVDSLGPEGIQKDLAKFVKIGKNGIATLTKAGQALQKAFGLIKFGEKIKDMQLQKQELKNRVVAMRVLLKLGFDNATATSLAAESATALAIATGQISVKDLKAYKKDMKALTKLQVDAARVQDIAQKTGIEGDIARAEALGKIVDAQEALIEGQYLLEKTALDKQKSENDYGLDLIAREEDKVNEVYDKQIESLQKINDLAEKNNALTSTRMSIADALAKGDIAAASSAMQEYRNAKIQQVAKTRMEALQKAKDNAIKSITVTDNKTGKISTREDLEKLNKDIDGKLADIDEKIRLQKEQLSVELKAASGMTTAEVKEFAKTGQLLIDAYGVEAANKMAKGLYKTLKGDGDAFNTTIAQGTTNLITFIAQLQAARKEAGLSDFTGAVPKTPGYLGVPGLNADGTFDPTTAASPNYGSTPTPPSKAPAGSGGSGGSKSSASTPTTPVVKVGTVAISTSPNAIDRAAAATAAAAKKTADAKKAVAKIPPWLKFASGGMVPKYMASGGFAKGTDTVPAMLTPGEFVINRKATQEFGPLLSAINSPTFSTPKSMSSSVMGSSGSQTAVNNSKTLYNYNLSVNVSNSNANPNDIARTVINQIKMIEDQRIRRY